MNPNRANLDFYWVIETWEGEKTKVRPDAQNIAMIQKKMNSGEGVIITPTQTISVKSIKSFSISDEPFTDQKLVEGAAVAFNEPQLTEDGSVLCAWVKKAIPKRRFESYHRYSPAYKVVEEGENFVIVGWRQPIHQIDRAQTQEMSQAEIVRMTHF